MFQNMSWIKNKKIIYVILAYLFMYKFFNCIYVSNVPNFNGLTVICMILVSILAASFVKRDLFKSDICGIVAKIIMMFIVSALWTYVYWGQSISDSYFSIFSVFSGGMMPLVFFFIFQKYNFSQEDAIKCFILGGVLYSICLIVGLQTIPEPLFGFSGADDIEKAYESSLDQRGVIRLNMPGADFVIMLIFLVLSYYRHKRKYYFLLIPLFILLILRGTRTPFFCATFIGIIYFISKIKNKFWVGVLMFAAYISIFAVSEALLKSDSDNAIVKYVQMTNNQIENNNESEDIRVEMAKYMVSEFNTTPLAYITGNGVPGRYGSYAKTMIKLGDNKGYYVVDVAFIHIFIYFGIVGLILYALLIFNVVRTKIPEKYDFAKLYIYYLVLIMPTNCSIVSMSSFMFAIALYIVYISNEKTKIVVR